MPRPSRSTLIWSEMQQRYELHPPGQIEQGFSPGNQEAFARWVEEQVSFAFVGKSGRLSVLKEARARGSGYWYAYRKQGHHTRKGYLGPSSRLTLTRLEELAKDGASVPPSPPLAGNLAHPLPDQKNTLLSPKLVPPRVPSFLVERPRLHSSLDAIWTLPLTLISSTAGSGKTTLLSVWARMQERPIAWLSLDALDNDLIRFWAASIAALRRCLPQLGEEAFALLHAPQSPPISTILTALLNDLALLDRDITLILDDYHVITDQTIQDSLLFLLDHLPAQMHLVLISRIDPELPLSRLRVRSQLLEIRFSDLHFTQEESTRFLLHRMNLPLSEEEAAILGNRTEGWIAGLQLVALSLSKQRNPSSAIADFGGSHRYLLDYVQQDILARLPDALQNFLLQTSVVTSMNAGICQALTAEPARGVSQQMLEEVERANLFVVPLDEHRSWYRYHDLFREALLARLQASCPDLIPLLHLRAAHWYEAQEELRAAIAQALAVPDYAYAADLMEQAAPQLLRSGEGRTVLSWMLSLPDPILGAHARLALSASLHLLYSTTVQLTSEVRQMITRLQALLHPSDPRLEHRSALLWSSEGESAVIERRLRLLHAWIETQAPLTFAGPKRREHLLSEIEALPQDEETNWNVIPLFLTYRLTDVTPGKRAFLIPRLLDAKQQVMQGAYDPTTIRIMILLHQAYLQTGQLQQSKEQSLEALALIEKRGVRTSMTGFLYLNLFDISYAQNQLEEAANWLPPILRIAQEWHQTYLLALGEISSVRLALARGDLAAAHQTLQRMEIVVEQEGYSSSILWEQIIRVHYWLASGNLAAASAWAVEPLRALDAGKSVFCEVILMLVRVLLAQQQSSQAAELLSRESEQLDQPTDVQTAIQFLALSVVALHQVGKRKEALHALVRLFALTEPEGHLRVYLDAGLPMKQALTSLLEAPSADGAWTGTLSRSSVFHVLAAFEQEARRLHQGQHAPSTRAHPVPRQLPHNVEEQRLISPLSQQEQRVLRLLVTGQTYAEMARTLVVSPNTIKTHVSSIYRKLDVNRRAEAIAMAARLHLL